MLTLKYPLLLTVALSSFIANWSCSSPESIFDSPGHDESSEILSVAISNRDVPSTTPAQIIGRYRGVEDRNVSFFVVDAETGEPVASMSADQPRTLASVTKIATGVLALTKLGSKPAVIVDVEDMLRTSDNLQASRLLRQAVSEATGMRLELGSEGGSCTSSPERFVKDKEYAEEALELLAKAFPIGLGSAGESWVDGAGCKHGNQMSSRHVVQLLLNADRENLAYKSFEHFLAVSGELGTLKSRMKDIAGVVHAKTGTLSVAITLAGYFHRNVPGESKPKRYIFAVLINNHNGKQQARDVIDEIVTNWVLNGFS